MMMKQEHPARQGLFVVWYPAQWESVGRNAADWSGSLPWQYIPSLANLG
jgi:hypothetical protein